MEVTTKFISELKPYEFNNRRHKEQQVERIAESITQFGMNQPIVVDENNEILVGHGRLFALKQLGEKTAPVLVREGLTEQQKKAYRILDNKLQNDSEWDFDNLTLEIDWLEDNGFDIDSWGLDDLRIDGEDPEATEDNFTPDESERTMLIKLGDEIRLGRHKVHCVDCTDPEAVAALMGGQRAKILQTDPPYGVAYVANAKSKGQSVAHEDIQNDELDGEKLQEFLESCLSASLPHLEKGCAFYLWHPMLTQGAFFAAAAAAADILIHRQIVWVKPSLVFGRGDYHWKHELCFYGWIRGNRPPFYGSKNQTTIWEIGRETSKVHPTAKPVQIWEAPLLNHTKKGDVAYEPFLGSGSQLIACEQLDRTCYGTEIEPKYCQVIVDRYIKHCSDNNKPIEIAINGERLTKEEWEEGTATIRA